MCVGGARIVRVMAMSKREAFEGAKISNGPHKGPYSTLKKIYRAWRDS